MATIPESLDQALTPQLTRQIGELLGVEEPQVREGVDVAAPLVLAGLTRETSTAGGAEKVLDLLGVTVPDLTAALEGGYVDNMLEQLFGIGAPKVAGWIENTMGFNIAPFLPITTALVMNALAHAVKDDGLDAAGLTKRIQHESELYARANPQLASEVNAAMDAGQNVAERAARIRAQFSDEEWSTLTKTPTLAGYAVMMSALSGPVGLSKELEALHTALHELGGAADPDSLVGLVSREIHSPDQISKLGANRSNATSMMRDACLEALRILTEKETYDESIAYKRFVVDVSTRVASAAIDGGLMSMGGKPISGEERMTLDLIAAALAYQPEP